MTAPGDVARSACERLELSRQRLKQALQADAAGAGQRPGQGGAAPGAQSDAQSGAGNAPHSPWLAGLRSTPGRSALLDALLAWWGYHPMRMYGVLASRAAETLARPVASRHPYGLVLSAAVIGALLVWSRPWRWIVKPALFAGLLPVLARATLRQMPLHAWLAALSSLMKRPASQEAARPH